MPILSLVETRLSQADFSSGRAVNAVMPEVTILRMGSGCGTKEIVAEGSSTRRIRPIHGWDEPESLAETTMPEQIKTIGNQNFIISGAFLDA